MSRLLSAWRDKFRKGHPWMRIIEPKFGKFLEKLETKDMSLEVIRLLNLSQYLLLVQKNFLKYSNYLAV